MPWRYQMNHIKSAILGLALVAGAASGAFAQSSGAMDENGMAKPMHMSSHEKHMMKSCMAMSHDAMMKNSGCAKMMKAHPDMMSDKMMNKDAMSH